MNLINPRDIMIANLAAATIMNDDPELNDWTELDKWDRRRLVQDYRDDFASSPFSILASAKITPKLADEIVAVLNALMIS